MRSLPMAHPRTPRQFDRIRRVVAGGWAVAEVAACEDDLSIPDRIALALDAQAMRCFIPSPKKKPRLV